MRIGITFDLKAARPAHAHVQPGQRPDDDQEEFDSPETIEAIAAVFRGLGHEVALLGDGRELIERLLERAPDLVFNFAEGQGVARSREARVPALLEMLGIPYTGSDPLTMSTTLDKDCAKRLAASAGIAVPRALVIPSSAGCDAATSQRKEYHDPLSWLPFPVVVKPAWEGSSKGIRSRCLVKSPEDLPDVIDSLHREQRQPIMVEEYIAGDEVTVGVIGNDPPEVFGIMRVSPVMPTEHFVYSLEIKRDYRRQVCYECPALLPTETTTRVKMAALQAYSVLGCRDVSRIDFRIRDGVPYFLEVNPLPGLNPEDSDLVIMARLLGWSHSRLVSAILDVALRRLGMDAASEQASRLAAAAN